MRRILTLVLSTAFLLAACGDGGSPEAVQSLIDEGMAEDTAECVVNSLVERGFTSNDIINNDNGEAVRIGLGVCLTDDDLPELLGVANLTEVRATLAQGMATGGSLTPTEAVCIVGTVEEQGFSLVEIGGFTRDIAEGNDVAAALSAAQASCAGQ